jgi:HD-GYP domain-containing protein (c-di-GMP phosphodiesterase class II)
VSRFAALLAERAALGGPFVEQARLCGLVHDIGKIGVPEEILRKPTKLEAHEFALIKQHPERGLSMLRDIPQLREILPGVLDHHERWDGQGYPNQSAGMDISQLGRVVGIADAFDAMTSSRLYRPARNTAAALDEIRRCAGTQFDPALAEVFAGISPEELEPIMSHRRPTMPVTDAFGT